MSETRHQPAAGRPHQEAFDEDLDVRRIVSFGIGLGLTMSVVLATTWLLLAHWRARQVALDPPPSPMAEARAPRQPPGPALQSAPVKDMRDLRAREDSVLTSYGWVDRRAGIGRIPIDRALDLLLERGLPIPPPAEAPAPRRRSP